MRYRRQLTDPGVSTRESRHDSASALRVAWPLPRRTFRRCTGSKGFQCPAASAAMVGIGGQSFCAAVDGSVHVGQTFQARDAGVPCEMARAEGIS